MTTEALIIGLAFTVVLIILSRALAKTKKQALVMKIQSAEISKHMLELERQNKELEKLNQEKEQIISLVSHDLKGPFNRIFALIQLMNMGQENLTDEQKEYLGKIHQITADGLGMLRNLLDSRRLELRGVELHEVSLDLSVLVASLVKNYRTIAEKKNIEILLEADESIIIQGDRLYLSRILENLLSNAVKFSPEGKKVFVKLKKKAKAIELSVKDEGPGISKEDQLKLYQRFHRLSARPTGGESSNGLGLFIIKTILDKLSAEIFCESELLQGTSFTVRLPQANLEG